MNAILLWKRCVYGIIGYTVDYMLRESNYHTWYIVYNFGIYKAAKFWENTGLAL